ncbi:MAG: hypothetical protein H0X66_11035 [Verrucomicrobia bacterium]|nr:hypothetical protein [Verrucomicrobiota bacterium]
MLPPEELPAGRATEPETLTPVVVVPLMEEAVAKKSSNASKSDRPKHARKTKTEIE